MANFERFQEWTDKLARIKAAYPYVQRYNKAVIVYYGPHEQSRRSMGVNRMLVNYYKPTKEETVAINRAEDHGEALNFAAFKPTIDDETFTANFRAFPEVKYETYDEGTITMSELNKLGVVPLSQPEFMLGSKSMAVRETPSERADWVHLTGSIDQLCYNRVTGHLVVMEVKSGFSGNGENTKFMTMRALHLKEKHCKQLTMYVYMLIAMAAEIGIVIAPEELDLMIVSQNKGKKKLAIWAFRYEPRTFLGSLWAKDRWHGIIDTGLLITAKPRIEKICCSICKGTEDVCKTKSTPVLIICKMCIPANKCGCGRLARYKNKMGKKFCDPRCSGIPEVIVVN